MNQIPKILDVISPVAILDNGSWTTNEIDTQGFDRCQIIFFIGATDVDMVALKVQESDLSGSQFTDVTGLVFGTSTNKAGSTSVIPTSTDDNKVWLFDIDLRGKKRYLDLVATAGDGTAGTYAAAVALLWRAGNTPETASAAACEEILEA